MKMNVYFLLLILILLSACQKKATRNEAIIIGQKGLEEYCDYKEQHAKQSEKVKISAFKNGDISSKDELQKGYNWCDWCVEYVTKSNVSPRHILLIFIKGDEIVERHSMIE
jgi:hypothetical protein